MFCPINFNASAALSIYGDWRRRTRNSILISGQLIFLQENIKENCFDQF